MRLRPSRQRRWRLRPPSLFRAWVGLRRLRPLGRSLLFLRRGWVRLVVLREEAPSCGFSQLACGAHSRIFPPYAFVGFLVFVSLAYTRLFSISINLLNVSFP